MIFFKKFFSKRPYRAVTAILFFIFLWLFRSRLDVGFWGKSSSFVSIISTLGFTVYFLRNLLKKTFRISFSSRRIKEKKTDEDFLEENMQEIIIFTRRVSFFFLWMFVPFSIALGTVFLLRHVPETVISPNYKLMLSLIVGPTFGIYFRFAEKIAVSNIRKTYEREHTILTFISLFSLLVLDLMILSNFWIINYNFFRSFILVSLSSLFFASWMFRRLKESISVNFIYPLIFISAIFSLVNFVILKQQNELLETVFLLFGSSFLILDSAQKLIFNSLTKTMIFTYIMLGISLSGLLFY